MRTKFFSLILALVAVLLPARMWADGETPWAAVYTNGTDYVLHFTYSSSVPDDYVTIDGKPMKHTNNETWYWDVTDTDGNEEDEGYPLPPGWYAEYNDRITKVVFDYSFQDARPTSMFHWFRGEWNQEESNPIYYSQLKTIEGWEYLNTSEVTSMEGLFWGCVQIETIDLSHFSTAKCKSFASMFDRCLSLKSLDLSSLDWSSVETARNMLQRCSSIKELDLSNIHAPQLTEMKYFFNLDTSLISVNMHNFRAPLLTSYNDLFIDCISLTDINVEDLDMSNITDIGGMFYGIGATVLDLSSWNTEKITNTGWTFRNCPNLTTIYVGEGWDMSNVTNSNFMFSGSPNLVGGKGTKVTKTNHVYARIDGGQEYPGYMTSINDVKSGTLDTNEDCSGFLEANIGQMCNITVTVKRPFAAGEWTTICLPFNMVGSNISNVFGEGTEIKKFSDASYNNGTFTLTFENQSYLLAGKPYLIKPANTVTSFTLRKSIETAVPSSITAGGLTMTGTFSPATVTPTGAYWNLYTPTSANYATLAQDADNSESVNGFQAYFTSINGTEYTLKVSSAGAATLYLPFNAQIPEDADYFIAAGLKEIDDIADNASIGRLRMIKQGIIPANTGVVILANPGSYTLRATEEETEETAAAATSENYSLLSGTLEATNTQALREANPGHTIYTLSRGTQQNFGFKPSVTGKVAVAQYRAYLAIATPAGAPVRDISLTFGDAELDEATGINEVNLNVEKASDGIYYNLNGQRVTVPTKGIYIKDGKKVYVK